MQVCADTLPAVYTAGTAGIFIQVCAGTGTGTDFRTDTGRFGKFGTTSIPAPESSVSRYNINTGAGGTGMYFRTGARHFRKFSIPPIPVPDNSVSSVQRRYRYRTLR